MILRKGEELDIKLKEIFTAKDSELKHLQKQNNYFRDGWVKLEEILPSEHQTNFDDRQQRQGFPKVRSNTQHS